jgi:hypothetical protein
MSPVNVKLTDLVKELDEERPAATPLEKISEAQVRSATLAATGDQLVGHYVALARAAGASWQQIGEAIGVSKQAAQQKWVAPTFERFTKRARSVVVRAQESARSHKHDYIGPEHLLLGLLGEPEGLAAQMLTNLAGPLDAVATAVEANLGPESKKTPKGHIAFTPQAKEILEQTLQAALRHGHNYIGTEHILLGLATESDGAAAKSFADLEITPEKLEEQLKEALAGYHKDAVARLRAAKAAAENAPEGGTESAGSDVEGEPPSGS